MQLIKPSEISSKIMTMIEDCDTRLILVSPYVKISKWYKLKNKIESTIKRNICIEFYIRDDNENKQSKSEVEEIGIEPILVPNMHCKMYLNEKYAIVTSMNLLLSSEINSLDIGYITETTEEYNEVFQFYNKYLSLYKKESSKKDVKTTYSGHWLDLISDELKAKYKKLYIETDRIGITVHTGINSYNAFLDKARQKGFLRISGIISGKQYDALSEEISLLEKEIGLKINTEKGAKGHYDLIWGRSEKPYLSDSIHDLKGDEAMRISNEVKQFILTIDARKKKI